MTHVVAPVVTAAAAFFTVHATTRSPPGRKLIVHITRSIISDSDHPLFVTGQKQPIQSWLVCHPIETQDIGRGEYIRRGKLLPCFIKRSSVEVLQDNFPHLRKTPRKN